MAEHVARHGRDPAGGEGDATAADAEVGTATDTGPARGSGRVGPTLRRGARLGWQGVRLGRAWLAKLVMLAALVVALLLGLGALLVGFGANAQNILASGVVAAAYRLAGPFGDLFVFPDHVKQDLVNWVIAAVVYLVVGGILSRLIRP